MPFIVEKHFNNAMSSTLKKINCIQQIRLCARIGVMVSTILLIEKYHSALNASASAALVVSAVGALVISTMPALKVRRQCWRGAVPVVNFLIFVES